MISPIVFYNLVLTLVAVGQYFVTPFALTEGTGDLDKSARFYTLYFTSRRSRTSLPATARRWRG